MPSETNCQLPHREPKTAANNTNTCPGHARWLAETLEDITETSALLPQFLEPGTAVDDGRQVRGKRIDPPAPVRLDVVALTDRRTTHRHPGDIIPALAILEAWAELVTSHHNLTTTKPSTLTNTTNTLATHLPWITAQDWVADFAAELREVKSSLHSAIGEHAPKPVGKCPVIYPEQPHPCDGPLYQDRHGGLSVTCRTCGQTWGENELRRLGLVIGA